MSQLDQHQKALAGLLRDNARRYRLHEVFRDFCEVAAISLSNAVDRLHYETREERYLQIVKRYERDEVHRFPAMLAELVLSLQRGHRDALGELFMSLELGDHWKGQFFTPYEVASLMARMTIGDVAAQVREQGFLTLNEPACGAGGMVIAFAEAMLDQGVNYQTTLHATAQDIDATAVHMAYVQLSLLHVPAIVVHGNSLTVTEWDHWATPAHALGGWDRRLQRRDAARHAAELSAVSPSIAPPLVGSLAADGPRDLIVRQRIAKAEQMSLFSSETTHTGSPYPMPHGAGLASTAVPGCEGAPLAQR